ncbi:MAG TPA: arginine deiminase-related protein [Candidatus Saccharimonadales bacterium]|nr:arginine deiminase-related protein [Candidatus Saccharimonadales bacterium]
MSKSVLMCPPTYFEIEYEINPWMSKDNPVDPELALQQWQAIYDIYTKQFGWDVKKIEPQQNLPDMVFTANGGLVIDGKVALPTFRAPDRQAETEHFNNWFYANGLQDFLEPKYDFEGEGDALVWNDLIFAGYPWRSDLASHSEIASFFDREVISLQLADARFYHLDTCLSIIDGDTVALWPEAFSVEALAKIHQTVPNVIEASEHDALAYGLNMPSDGTQVVVSEGAPDLANRLIELGKTVVTTSISEFQKSGGGIKCLTLELRAS